MTSPLLRLFAVCWWLLVLGGAGFAILGTGIVWEDYHLLQRYMETDHPPDPPWHVAAGAVVLLVSLLPFAIMTVIRRIITSRWPLVLRPALVVLAPSSAPV